MVTDPSNPAAEEDEEDPCAPKRVVVKKMASLLVKPKVSFVSLVGHAANGMPFSVVKNEDGTASILNPSTPMPKPIPTFGSAAATLNRMEFDLTLFKTEDAVEAYLKKSNITVPKVIAKTETHFIVSGVHADSLEQIEAVKGDVDGVTYWIGRLKAPLASIKPPSPAAPTQTATVPGATIPNPAAVIKGEGTPPPARLRGDDGQEEDVNEHERVFKSEMAPELREVVTKMDSYIARQVGTTNLDDTLTTGEPEIPGMWQILRGIEVTVQNIIAKGNPAEFSAKIQAAFARGGEITAGLAGIFVAVAKSEPDKDGKVVETITLDRTAIVKHFSSQAPVAAPAAEGAGVVKKGEPAKEGEGEPAATPAPEDATGVVALLKAELAPVLLQLGGITSGVEAVQKTATSLESRVVTLESVQQVRKSLPDDGETPVAKSEADKQQEIRKAEKAQRAEAERKADEEFAKRQAQSKLGLVV